MKDIANPMRVITRLTLTLIYLVHQIHQTDAQLSAMFGNAIQAKNCGHWTSWGPCIWVKGQTARSHRSYFEQLLPGKDGCRDHAFFRLLREQWGTAFSNFYNYLRNVTISETQCGQCSYQQSCGRNCIRSGNFDVINPLFVAERLCTDVDQSIACTSKWIKDCRFWPNPDIKLPNVSSTLNDVIQKIDYLACIPQKRANEPDVCRCCCHPYVPNPKTFRCEPKHDLNMQQSLYEQIQSSLN